MSTPCSIPGCKTAVPPELDAQHLCVLHLLIEIERVSTEMRLESVRGSTTAERRAEINRYIADQGGLLARVATGSLRLPDETKARILNTFLILMNLRENVERAAERLKSARSSP
jgi:hypothetical protein